MRNTLEVEIMDYIILTETHRVRMQNLIQESLTQGWRLVGGLSVVWDGKEKRYYQAVKQKL